MFLIMLRKDLLYLPMYCIPQNYYFLELMGLKNTGLQTWTVFSHNKGLFHAECVANVLADNRALPDKKKCRADIAFTLDTSKDSKLVSLANKKVKFNIFDTSIYISRHPRKK
eukprot:GHVU01129524.1.p1 GENE.GHVU01129524.1~~GHVU01129524.1.p1  ORF type:complete len:112 (-),score=2.93 GHVU01129524.1:235-570(-)